MWSPTIALCYLVKIFLWFVFVFYGRYNGRKCPSELYGCVVQFFQERCREEIIFTEAILRICFSSQKSPGNFHCGHEEETQCLASRNGKCLLRKFTSSCKLLEMIGKMSTWRPVESYRGIKLGN